MRSRLKMIVNFFKNNKIAAFTVFAYIVVLVYSTNLGIDSLKMTASYFLEMLEILPAVFIVMGMVEVWVSRETIMGIFGKGAGLKGRFASVLIGSFSAGPIYAAFPVCYTLLKKGSAVSNIVIILSAWAVVKAPMLIVETQFMGLSFMVVRYIFTVPAIIMIGIVTGKVISEEYVIKNSSKDGLLVEKIDELLPGHNCGACGHSSCRETAERIVDGDEEPNVCVPLEEGKKIRELLETVS
ncbi:MAG: (Fe-S)-binding protein [Thermoplasmatota archaeon]